MNQYDPFVNELAQAIRAYKPMPAFPEGLTLDEAYSILPKVAARACDQQVRGLKAVSELVSAPWIGRATQLSLL